MARRYYLDDPQAPKANSLVPSASAIITDAQGRILLEKRRDNSLWGLPGGAMEIGESIGETIVREVKEETGLDVLPQAIVGLYTNPHHVIAYSDGEVRQQCSICFACTLVGGTLQVDDESSQVAFFAPQDIAHLAMHPSTRLRIQHFLEQKAPVIE